MEEQKTKKYRYHSQIWVEPRATIRHVIEEDPNKLLWLFSVVYGFSQLIGLFRTIAIGHQISLLKTLFVAGVFGSIYGFVGISILALLLFWTGKLFGGKGTYKQVRAACAWSCYPFIVSSLVGLFLCAFFGKDLFMNITENKALTQTEVAVLLGSFYINTAMWMWSWIILINGLAQVQFWKKPSEISDAEPTQVQGKDVLKTIGSVIVAFILLGLFFYAFLFFGVQGSHNVSSFIRGVHL